MGLIVNYNQLNATIILDFQYDNREYKPVKI